VGLSHMIGHLSTSHVFLSPWLISSAKDWGAVYLSHLVSRSTAKQLWRNDASFRNPDLKLSQGLKENAA
jgi:hypothetical protein